MKPSWRSHASAEYRLVTNDDNRLQMPRRIEDLPTEEPHSPIHVDGVQTRNRPGLVVDWVDLRGLEEQHWVVHVGGCIEGLPDVN